MNLFRLLYTEAIYRPLLNALVLVYLTLPYRDLGLAIIVLTAVVRLLLHPTLVQTVRSQRAMAAVQPRLREIQQRFKGNREEIARRTMILYREAGVHPLSGCLPILIQLPVLIGLYRVFWTGITLADRSLLYAFVPPIDAFHTVAFGLFDLAARNPILAVLAGASQFLQARMLPQPGAGGQGDEMARALRWQMTYAFPVIIAVISWSLPAALALYWTAFTLIAILQQRWIERRLSHEPAPRTGHPDAREDGHPR